MKKKNDNPDGNHSGTATHKTCKRCLLCINKTQQQYLNPLFLNEIAKMLKEIEGEKHKYEKRNELLDLKEKTLESLRADMDAERKGT